jgi:hypothetical protein
MAKETLTRTAKRRVSSIMESLSEIFKSASVIQEPEVTELVRRASISVTPDSFPTNSLPGHVSGSATGSSAVESAVEARLNQREDSVLKDLKRLEKGLRDAEHFLRDAVGILGNVDREIEVKRERVVSDPCPICLELPIEKAGWCNPDYTSWVRYGKPDRLLWEMYKRGDQMKDDVTGLNVPMVPDCPPPSNENVATRGPFKQNKTPDGIAGIYAPDQPLDIQTNCLTSLHP